MDFTETFLQGVSQGRAQKQQKLDQERQAEELDLRKLMLKHQLDQVKIQQRATEFSQGMQTRQQANSEAQAQQGKVSGAQPPVDVSMDLRGQGAPPIAIPQAPQEFINRTLPAGGGLPESQVPVQTQEGALAAFGRKKEAETLARNTALATEPISPTKQAELRQRGAEAAARSAEARQRSADTRRGQDINAKQGSAGNIGFASSQQAVTPQSIAQGDAFAATLDPAYLKVIKSYAEGRAPFPSGTSLKDPKIQALITDIVTYDPSFDASDFNARNRARVAFTSGKEAQNVRRLHQLSAHMERFSDSVAKMGNTRFPALNSLLNFASRQTGSSKVTNFETDRQAVVNEVVTFWRTTGGTREDIEDQLKNFETAGSPEQLNDAIGRIVGLLEGAIESYDTQKTQALGRFQDQVPVKTSTTDRIFKKLLGKTTFAAEETGTAPDSGAPGGGGLPVGTEGIINGQPAVWDGKGWLPKGN